MCLPEGEEEGGARQDRPEMVHRRMLKNLPHTAVRKTRLRSSTIHSRIYICLFLYFPLVIRFRLCVDTLHSCKDSVALV